jgi:hypothetical protein
MLKSTAKVRDQTLESLGKASAIEVVSKSSDRLELSNQRSRGWVWSSGFPARIFVDSASLAVAYFTRSQLFHEFSFHPQTPLINPINHNVRNTL